MRASIPYRDSGWRSVGTSDWALRVPARPSPSQAMRFALQTTTRIRLERAAVAVERTALGCRWRGAYQAGTEAEDDMTSRLDAIRQLVGDLKTITTQTRDPRVIVTRLSPLVRDLPCRKRGSRRSTMTVTRARGLAPICCTKNRTTRWRSSPGPGSRDGARRPTTTGPGRCWRG